VPVQHVALAALAGAFVMLVAMPAVAFLMPLAFAALIWSLAEDRGLLSRALGGRVGAALGLRSYSIYLLHPVLLVAFWPVREQAEGFVQNAALVGLYLALLLLVSGWSYHWVEAPARAFCNRLAAGIEAGGRREEAMAQGPAGG